MLLFIHFIYAVGIEIDGQVESAEGKYNIFNWFLRNLMY